ncbi:protein kinase C-binding protein NELL2 [Pimephales promelas]|nr:protein kinase C-binding protein NELL2 [Pimephales promelas]
MVQEGGARGVQLFKPTQELTFPSSQLFINCAHFPAEFSIVATLKVPQTRVKKNEYLLAVVKEDVDQLLLGLRFSKDKVHLIYRGSMGLERLSFKRIRLADNHWHSMVLAISGHHATLTLDCGIPLELVHKQPFPSDLSTDGSRFHIGSRRKLKGLFSGLLRQLVLLPGSDATSRVCPSSKPSLVELSVPTILSNLPVKYHMNDVLLPPYETEVRVTLGSKPACTAAEQGQLWFDTLKRGLFLCDGAYWHSMLQDKDRLDYVDDHQDLYTTSETQDIELFQIPSVGMFAAMAHRATKPGSAIYRWTHGHFQLYQNISTFKAQAWKQFTIGRKMFLAVSNSMGPADGKQELSVIYRWSNKRLKFLRYQTLETHSARDWEAFHINNEAFLAVANHRTGWSYNGVVGLNQEIIIINRLVHTSPVKSLESLILTKAFI